MPLKCFPNPCCVKKHCSWHLLFRVLLLLLLSFWSSFYLSHISHLALSVLSKFLLHIKISCFCNILININTTFIYAPCAVCSEQRAHILHTENMHCCHLFVSVYVCLRFDVDRMRIQYGFVIPWISHHLKIAIQYTLCACVYGVRVVDVVCVCAYVHRFYFQISIWFLFAYYNILPVHSFICIAIYLHSFVHLYTLFAVVLLLLSLSFQIVLCISLEHFFAPQLLPHFCALDRQAEIHFICHTINVIIGNLQKRFLFLLHSRNWIYFFICFCLCVCPDFHCSRTRSLASSHV